MFKAYIKCMWDNTFDFDGVTGRKDFWLAVLAHIIIQFMIVFTGGSYAGFF